MTPEKQPNESDQKGADQESQDSNQSRDRFKVFLKRADQSAVAGILLVCGAAFVIFIVTDYWRRGGTVEIEDAPPRQYQHHVNINLAEWHEIANLPGVGETLAKRIIEYREEHGPFKNLEAINNVRGIGPAKLEKIKQFLPHRPDGTLLVNQH